MLARLGGSYTTITKHLKDWEIEREKVPAPLALPVELTTHATELARVLWTAAHAEAQRDLEQLRTEHTQQREAVRGELAEATAIIERLETEAEARTSTIARLEEQEISLRQALAKVQAEQRLAEERLADGQGAVERAREQQRATQERYEAQLREVGVQAGELVALRRQVEEQAALIGRLTAPQK